jgi:Zn-dependent protease
MVNGETRLEHFQLGAEPPSAAAESWIAIAGPIVSFALAALFNFLQPIFTGIAPVLALAEYLAYINSTLALFNLIPGFPLDGAASFGPSFGASPATCARLL